MNQALILADAMALATEVQNKTVAQKGLSTTFI